VIGRAVTWAEAAVTAEGGGWVAKVGRSLLSVALPTRNNTGTPFR